jgi:hypothetical protein
MAALIDTYSMPPMSLLAQYAGACRYISHDSSKCITSGQVHAIHGAGKTVVLNFEDAATNAQGGTQQGAADARFAVTVARTLAAPAGCCIYYSVDFEATSSQMPTVQAYFRAIRGVHAGTGYLVGAYGDATVITALLQAGVIDLGWQTVAWSYGARVRDPRAALLQDQFNGSYDVDEITNPYYGGWTPHGPQTNPRQTAEEPDMTPAQAQQLADALTAARQAQATAAAALTAAQEAGLYIQIVDDPVCKDAIYLLTGAGLLWLTPADYAGCGSPPPKKVPHDGRLAALQCVPGTPDPRKGQK